MDIIRFYKIPGLKSGQLKSKFNDIIQITNQINSVETEFCYYVEIKEHLTEEELKILKWILSSPLESHNLKSSSTFNEKLNNCLIIEIGPR